MSRAIQRATLVIHIQCQCMLLKGTSISVVWYFVSSTGDGDGRWFTLNWVKKGKFFKMMRIFVHSPSTGFPPFKASQFQDLFKTFSRLNYVEIKTQLIGFGQIVTKHQVAGKSTKEFGMMCLRLLNDHSGRFFNKMAIFKDFFQTLSEKSQNSKPFQGPWTFIQEPCIQFQDNYVYPLKFSWGKHCNLLVHLRKFLFYIMNGIQNPA
jgi:hypothetical protein